MYSGSQIYFNKNCDDVTIDDIQKLIDENVTEDYTLDYKALNKNPQYGKYGKVISSFLNTNGGLLMLGISEKDHKYPDEITWSNISRETLVQNLYNIVDPWSSEIKIKPIENPEDESERIFIIDVPKSKNPPHMASNVYYYRNVYESIPMTHSQVKVIFTESYLAKEKLIEYIYGPLFNDVTIIVDNLTYDYVVDISRMEEMNYNYKYLLYSIEVYDVIDSIDYFYGIIKKRNNLVRLYQYTINGIIKKCVYDSYELINEHLGAAKINKEAILQNQEILWYRSGIVDRSSNSRYEVADLPKSLLMKVSPDEELLKRSFVIKILDEKDIMLLPNDQNNKRNISENLFNELYEIIKNKVSEHKDIQVIWTLTEQLENESYSMIDLLAEKIQF